MTLLYNNLILFSFNISSSILSLSILEYSSIFDFNSSQLKENKYFNTSLIFSKLILLKLLVVLKYSKSLINFFKFVKFSNCFKSNKYLTI